MPLHSLSMPRLSGTPAWPRSGMPLRPSGRDMAGLQSKLDSQYSRQLAERDREIRDLTSRLESDLLARMTPEERSAYEAESRTDKERRLQEELEQEKGARQAAISMINYAPRLTR